MLGPEGCLQGNKGCVVIDYCTYVRRTYSTYANLSLLFARFHAKIIPWGHDSQDFVELGFFESDGEEDDEYDEEDAALLGF